MTLNENLQFDDADPSVKRAFLRTPDRLLLHPGTRLYKWTNRPLVNGTSISPWWSFVETRQLPNGMIAEGFRLSEERARRIGKTHRTFARARAAISDQFGNTMSKLLLVGLTQPAWGFAGQASGQPEFGSTDPDRDNVFLIGGAVQVWIPGLTPQHIQELPSRG